MEFSSANDEVQSKDALQNMLGGTLPQPIYLQSHALNSNSKL